MVADQQTADILLPGGRAVGRWTQYGDLVRYGWQLNGDTDADTSVGQNALEDGHIFEELSINGEENVKVEIDHSADKTVDGKEYKETGAYYNSLFNVNSGLIVADSNSSPRAQKEDWPTEDLPPLRQWSDVIFILWQKIAGSNVQGLQHHIQYSIANEDTTGRLFSHYGEVEKHSGQVPWNTMLSLVAPMALGSLGS
ncbi:hypothetical protein BDW75DRAFT_245881 [Aspergillus navahoensis]